jgi:hypothetical protein
MHENKENEDGKVPRASRAKYLLRLAGHKAHGVSEYLHLGYFASAAGIMHEFHSALAAACAVALLLVLAAGASYIGDA